MFTVESIDHFVLTVHDLDRTVEFYSRVLGLTPITFGTGRAALKIGRQKINLHQVGQEFEPNASVPCPGSMDFCLVASGSLAEVIKHVQHCGVEIIEGPVARTGARGPLMSIYIRDPDGNLVEIAGYEGA